MKYIAFVAVLITLALFPGAAPGQDEEKVIEFDEAKIFFEFNATDLDLGIHIFFDAEGWKEVRVSGPGGTTFQVKNGGSLKEIGSTEVFTESAEPPLDEENLQESMAEFLARFPEGEYEFKGKTVEGKKLVGTAVLTHNPQEEVLTAHSPIRPVCFLSCESPPCRAYDALCTLTLALAHTSAPKE